MEGTAYIGAGASSVSSRRRRALSPSLYGERRTKTEGGGRRTPFGVETVRGDWGSGWAGPARREEERRRQLRLGLVRCGPKAPLHYFFLLKHFSNSV